MAAIKDTITLRWTVAEENEFVPGDVVRLKSGGPDMTVLDTCEDCGSVEVAYSDGVGAIHDSFPCACLERVNVD